jgi:hypothetical protein
MQPFDWYIFPTKAEADDANAAISAAIGLPACARHASTNEIDEGVVTECWALPRECVGGWAVPAHEAAPFQRETVPSPVFLNG